MVQDGKYNQKEKQKPHFDDIVIDLLSTKAAKIVSNELIQREERRAKRTTIIFSILALLGLSGIAGIISIQINLAVNSSLKKEIPKLEPIIEKKVRQIVDDNIGEVKKSLKDNEEFDDFLELVNQLEENEDLIPNNIRDSIIEKVRYLGKIERIRNRNKFMISISKVVKRFVLADLNLQLDELDDLVGDIIARDTEAALAITDHFGERIIGSAYTIDRLANEIERLKKYFNSARLRGYPEKALMWQIFIEFKRNNYTQNDTTTKLVESISDLNDTDTKELYRVVEWYSDPSIWQIITNQEGREMARLISSLRVVYPSMQKPLPGNNANSSRAHQSQ